MQRSVILSSFVLLAAGLIQFACVQDFDQFDPANGSGGSAGADVSSSSSSGSAGAGGAVSSSSSSAASSSASSSSSSSSGGMPCMKNGDCPMDTPCANWSCTMGMCTVVYDPTGMVVNDPTNGDCKANGCDGMGNIVEINDDTDTPAPDGNMCTTEACNNGVPMTTNDPVGSACNGGVCNAMAMCVGCIADADCNTGTNPSCFMETCISCSDGMKNGDETDVDCGGTHCKKCDGNTCAANMDCTSGFCADGVCCNTACDTDCKSCNLTGTEGTCTNIAVGMTDAMPACTGTMACNGSGVCKSANGETCTNNMDCASNNCTGNPKKCAP